MEGIPCSSIFVHLLLIHQNPTESHDPDPMKSFLSELLYYFLFFPHSYSSYELFWYYLFYVIEMLLVHFIVINIYLCFSLVTVYTACLNYISIDDELTIFVV